MELDPALELAVVAAWADLVKPGEFCSVHVEYEKVGSAALQSLEVWTFRNRGYGTLVCRCFSLSSSGTLPSEAPAIVFANSYRSNRLADDLDFIIRNQRRFTRPLDGSVHGLVQIRKPCKKDIGDAATWSQAVVSEFAETVWN